MEATGGRSTDLFYFAYGANMNSERMNITQIHFSKRQRAKLLDYEFILNTKRINGTAAANIRPKVGCCVYGVLYTCTSETLNNLDDLVSKELYTRERINVMLVDGTEVQAHSYIANCSSCDDTLTSVNRDYLDHILCGRDLLPKAYTDFLESFMSWAVNSCPSEEYFLLGAANETEE